MAGHNKWSKVKHIKAREDAKKGKMFSKFSHEISIAARDGGGDADLNPRLRTAIDSAKGQSMPKDNIEGAIKEGTGELVSIAQNPTLLEDPSIARQAIRLYGHLDDYDDTMNVYTNFEVADAVLAGLDA